MPGGTLTHVTVHPVFDLDRIGAGLPAGVLVDRIGRLAAERRGLRAVVEAPPGSGKTTVVPPALAMALATTHTAAEDADTCARILVSQPRRVAARAAAHRLAHLSGREVGGAVGYTVRGDRRTGQDTRVEFATTGVILRRLLNDPDLTGVDAVVLDEVHERSLATDLSFAILRELVDLRDDLSLVVMSATLDAADWARRLTEPDADSSSAVSGAGGSAPILRVEAQPHPLTVRWSPPPRRAVDERGVRPDFLAHVAGTVDHALAAGPGDVLVFAPGHREVDRIAAQVRSRRSGVDVLTLTGSTPRREQSTVLRGGEDPAGSGRRRVVVATSVAESALTVPGVRIVVDSCLSRVPHFDTGRGVGGLTTVRVSKASGDQRAGRAAREGPGTVWRCSSEAEWAAFPAHTSPEILTADLTGAVLDLAVWGSPGGTGLPLPTPLPDLPLQAATRTLHGLGALESPAPAARATAFGRALAAVPADPRTARGLLLATPVIGPRQAAECAALLSLDVRAVDGDLTALLRRARGSHDAAPAGWGREVQRLSRIARAHADADMSSAPLLAGSPAVRDLGVVLALSRPDMIAQLRAGSDSDYLLASGTGAQLQRGSALHGEEWIVVADAAVVGGRTLVRAGAVIDEATALWAGSGLRSIHDLADWRDGRLRGRRVDSLGAITLTSTPVGVTEESASAGIADAVQGALGRLAVGDPPGAAFAGLAGGGEAESFESLRGRLGLLQQVCGEPWPDVRSEALAGTLDDWLGLEIRRAARMLASGGTGGTGSGAGPKRTVRLRLCEALQGLLPWPDAVDLDRLVPHRIAVPSGSSVRLAYPRPEEHAADDGPHTSPPVLAVKLQEMFGASDGPAVIDGRVPVLVHLLSPARRPLAVTADLASFWNGAYAHVRAENRGRYPKHPWPEDPRSAPPTKHTSKRSTRT